MKTISLAILGIPKQVRISTSLVVEQLEGFHFLRNPSSATIKSALITDKLTVQLNLSAYLQ
ncbi:MAG: hypothetical protein ACOYMQ_17240 [Pseudanabaena sp.]|jgi:hypothetical protein